MRRRRAKATVKNHQKSLRNMQYIICTRIWIIILIFLFVFFSTQLPWNREPACREARKTSIAEARDILAVFLVSPFSILFDCESIYLYLRSFRSCDSAPEIRRNECAILHYLRFYLRSTIRNLLYRYPAVYFAAYKNVSRIFDFSTISPSHGFA